jgi:hypothetical protein
LAPVAVITGEAVYNGGQEGKGCHIKTARWGYIGPGGGWVIQPAFDEAEEFHEGLAAVTFTGGKTGGYVDTSGKTVFRTSLPAEFGHFQGGIALVRDRGKGTNLIVDHTGRVRFSQARDLAVIGEGLVRFSESYDGPFGIEDSDGKLLVAPKFEELGVSSEGLIAAKNNKRWGFIDRTGKVVIPNAFDDRAWDAGTKVYGFHAGLSAVYQNGKFGYIGHTGQFVIPARFADAGPFTSGLAYACIALNTAQTPKGERDTRCGFIDQSGNFKTSPRFGSLEAFDEGWAVAFDPVIGEEMRVNLAGRIVDRPRYEDRPHTGPYGECHFPPAAPAAPPPRSYSVTTSLLSTPPGALVYLIPLWDWETNNAGAAILSDPNLLETYLIARGGTPIEEIEIKAQVYMAVFDLAGKRKVTRVSVTGKGDQGIRISF